MAGGGAGVAAPGGAPTPHVDAGLFAQLVADLGADHVLELCAVFLGDGRERVDAMRTACKDGDADAASRSAHRLKSSSGFLGAGRMEVLCRKIERLAAEDRLSEVGELVDQVAGELDHLTRELHGLVRRVAPGG